jgi:hypothetical protein
MVRDNQVGVDMDDSTCSKGNKKISLQYRKIHKYGDEVDVVLDGACGG